MSYLAQVPAILAILISIGTFVFSFREARRQRSVVEAQARLLRDLDIIHWGQEAVEALSTAWHLACDHRDGLTDAQFSKLRREAAMKLSSLADKGRFYLPNVEQDKFRPKLIPASRRGYRHAALDELIEAYDVLESWDAYAHPSLAPHCDTIFEARRLFVDAVINEIQPTLHFSLDQTVTKRQKQKAN